MRVDPATGFDPAVRPGDGVFDLRQFRDNVRAARARPPPGLGGDIYPREPRDLRGRAAAVPLATGGAAISPPRIIFHLRLSVRNMMCGF
jgi:hypothetical protein